MLFLEQQKLSTPTSSPFLPISNPDSSCPLLEGVESTLEQQCILLVENGDVQGLHTLLVQNQSNINVQKIDINAKVFVSFLNFFTVKYFLLTLSLFLHIFSSSEKFFRPMNVLL